MAPKLYKAVEVCDIAQLQAYVLRSWEKEFPGIGVQKSPDSPRLYRQSDLDQVLRIRQLVFGEGLTLAGARRRMEDEFPPPVRRDEASAVIAVLGADARSRITHIRDGLRSLLHLLGHAQGRAADAYQLTPPPVRPTMHMTAQPSRPASAPRKPTVPARSSKAAVSSRGSVRGKAAPKRKRASA
jgi:DNA-binding transcriptional MerR regulator